jgi:hypothetical protein
MDFKGETPQLAAAQLLEFLHGLAAAEDATLRCAHVAADGPRMLWLKRKLGLARHGGGYLLFRGASARLRLLRDEEGIYRWHRIAGRPGLLRPVAPARGAHWFPLLESHLRELAAAEAPKTAKVLTMKTGP